MNITVIVNHEEKDHSQILFLNNVNMVSSNIKKVSVKDDSEDTGENPRIFKSFAYERILILISDDFVYKMTIEKKTSERLSSISLFNQQIMENMKDMDSTSISVDSDKIKIYKVLGEKSINMTNVIIK